MSKAIKVSEDIYEELKSISQKNGTSMSKLLGEAWKTYHGTQKVGNETVNNEDVELGDHLAVNNDDRWVTIGIEGIIAGLVIYFLYKLYRGGSI